METQEAQTILSRLDRLEVTLTERQIGNERRQALTDRRLSTLEERVREVEISQARLLVMFGTGSTLGGLIGGIIVLIGRAWGLT